MGLSLRDRLQAILAGFVDDDTARPVPGFAVHCCLPPSTSSSLSDTEAVSSSLFSVATAEEALSATVATIVPPFLSDGVAASVSCVSPGRDSLVWGAADGLLRRIVEASLPTHQLLLSAIRADADRLHDLVVGDDCAQDEWKIRWASLASSADVESCISETADTLSRRRSSAARIYRLAHAESLDGPFLTIVELPTEDAEAAACPFASTTQWYGVANVLQAIAYALPFVPYCSSASGRVLANALSRAAEHHVLLDLRATHDPSAALATLSPLLHSLLLPPPGAESDTALQALRGSIREGFQVLSAVAADPSPSGSALQRCLDFERSVLEGQHALWLQFLGTGDGQLPPQPRPPTQGSTSLRWVCRAHHLASCTALEADYRAMAVRLLEDSQLRSKAEQVLWRAQLEQQGKALRQLQQVQARQERDLQGSTRRSSSSIDDLKASQLGLVRKDSRPLLSYSEWLDDTVAQHHAALLEAKCSDVPREEVERRLEALENLYQTRQHQYAAAGRLTPPTPTNRSCVELQKVIQTLHQDLMEKGLQQYRQGEALEAARRQLQAEADQTAAWREMALKERREHASLRHLHDRILGLAAGLFDFTALHLLSGRRAVRGSDEMLPQFLRGVEAVLVDGLQDGCSFWDFVEHTQKTMDSKLCRKEFVNPSAKEQVSTVLALERDGLPLTGRERGQLWLLLALNRRSLLDAIHSLDAMQPAYYTDGAFFSSPEGHGFVMAALRLIHLLPFRLSMTDIRWFDGGPAGSPGLSHLQSSDAPAPNGGTPFTLLSKSPSLAAESRMPPLDLGRWNDGASVSSSQMGRGASAAFDRLSSHASVRGFFSSRFR